MRLPDPLGTYDVLEQIGSGGEAVVYRARDRAGREWALKIYHEQGAADRLVWSRLKLLTHRALMQISHTGQLQDLRDYEVMPYFRGRSLQGQGPMAQDELLAVVRELIGGINQLHTADIVHRDLKPANILYDPAARAVKISDFGISRAPRQQTRVAYTVGYAPPEAYDPLITPAWDWWSLGAIVYELATGAVLFGGRSAAQIKALVRDGEITHLDKLPPRWRTLCAGLLVADPERRWGSGEALAWLHGDDVPAAASGAAQQATVRDPGPAPARPAADAQQPAPGPVQRPEASTFAYDGEEYRSPLGLAAALSRRPRRAAEEFFGPPGDAAAPGTAPGAGPARLRALAAWTGRQLPAQVASTGQDPIVRLNHLLHWLDPMSPPVLDAGPLRPAALVRLCVRAGQTGADAADRRAMAVVASGQLLRQWARCPGFEALKGVHAAWLAARTEWEGAVAAQSPHVRRRLEPAQPVVEALMLLALLPYPGAEDAVRQLARPEAAPPGAAVDWYDALVRRFDARGSLLGLVARAVCGPVALAAADGETAAEKAKTPKTPSSATAPKAPEKAHTQPASPPVLDFHGRHRTGAALAQALRTHKDEAMSVFLDASGAPRAGELAAWLRTLKESPEGRVDDLGTLLGQRLTGGAGTDVKLLYLLRWLAPAGAAPYGGRNVTVQGVIDACGAVLGKASGTKAHTFVRTLAAPLALDALSGFRALAALGPAWETLARFQQTLWRSLGRHGVSPAERADQVLAAGLLLGLGTDHAWRTLSEAAGKEDARSGARGAWFAPVLAELGGHGSRQGAAVEAALLPLARRYGAAQPAKSAAGATPSKAQASKAQATKSQATKSQTPKAQSATAAPAKPPQAKAQQPKSPQTKLPQTKAAQGKTTQAKSTQAKTTQAKTTQAKATQPKQGKSAQAKAAKPAPAPSKSPQPKSPQPKSPQPKGPQPKAKKAQSGQTAPHKAKKASSGAAQGKKAQSAGAAQQKTANSAVPPAQPAAGSRLTELIKAWWNGRTQ
ncbi:protein kinase [Streptomyces sp. NPDC006193]|uniref:serine/threonine-protein kinase n=1 Tax=Streptomyces sp. NPDC006193 TaxID=3155717 RepID=UPI00339F14FA